MVLLRKFDNFIDYHQIEAEMKETANYCSINNLPGEVWVLQHPHVYTAGLGQEIADSYILHNDVKVPLYKVTRGGKMTYHGPGQMVVYTILNLKIIYGGKIDIKKFIRDLSNWLIEALQVVGVTASLDDEHVGIWVGRKKIAFIGIKIAKWVSYHGVALNISNDLEMFKNIVPCGITNRDGICSLRSLGNSVTIEEFSDILMKKFEKIFGFVLNYENKIGDEI